MIGQHRVVRRRADGAAVDGAGPDAVERAAVVVDRAAEEPVRQAQLERDDVRQREDGHLVALVAARRAPAPNGSVMAGSLHMLAFGPLFLSVGFARLAP